MNRPAALTKPAALAIAFALGVALVAAGCGSDSGASPSTTTSGSSKATSLTVTVQAGPDAQPQTWTLTCDPIGGTHPDPQAACAGLAAATAAGDPFAPVPGDTACTEIYGGDQTATVSGISAGKPVSATYSRTNGCEIARWDAMQPVLVDAGGV